MFAVIGPSMNEQRGPPAFLRRSASKLASAFQRSSTPFSSSGRSTLDPTAVNRSFASTVRSTSRNGNAVPCPRDGKSRCTTQRRVQRLPLDIGVAVSVRFYCATGSSGRGSCGGIGVDGPSSAFARVYGRGARCRTIR